MRFTPDEYQLLNDALDSVVFQREMAHEMTKALFASTRTNDGLIAQKQAEHERDQSVLRDRIVMLKAKLLGLRNAAVADDAADALSGNAGSL
mgnify:CR=1 FL=1